MSQKIIKSAKIVNEGTIFFGDILINGNYIEKIADNISSSNCEIIDANGNYVLPGLIDDQVHFREPGLTHKADIYSESRAAVAGGVTSFMEMPNTIPNAVTPELLEEKYNIASKNSIANFSFYIGISEQHWQEALKADFSKVCGIKIFLGSSTGNLTVKNENIIRNVFSEAESIIAVHSEDDKIINQNLNRIKEQYGENITPDFHSEIRDVKACFEMTKFISSIAKSTGARLHILHISTEEELEFFIPSIDYKNKNITAEVCVHHLYFDKTHYSNLGNLIKCNPSIKESRHKEVLFNAMLDDRIDVIATDHAPHTFKEKCEPYLNAPSGIPLVQHSLNIMLEFYNSGKITLEKIVEKMCHNPAKLFNIEKRGFIREGYYADLVILDLAQKWEVNKENILYKCKWSPLEGHQFKGLVTHTFVNGNLVYSGGKVNGDIAGKRLMFKK